MSNILAKMGAFRKKRTVREIEGVEFGFYPCRMRRLLTGEIRSVLVPIYEAVQILFQSKKADQEIIEEVCPDGTVARNIKPAPEDLARLRAEQREKAMMGAMDTLFNDDTRYEIGRLILDSLRDEQETKPTMDDARAFVDSDDMDLPVFIEFFKGFLAANTTIFGDLGNLIRERMKQAISKMTVPGEESQEMEPTETEGMEDFSEAPDEDLDSPMM